MSIAPSVFQENKIKKHKKKIKKVKKPKTNKKRTY